MSTKSLIGLTYSDVLHRTITILSEDPVIGPGYYLVERDDGARWGVKAKLLERLFPLETEPKGSKNASPQTDQGFSQVLHRPGHDQDN